MTENAETTTIRTPADFFSAVLEFADKGVGKGRLGERDGKLSIAEINQAFRDNKLPADNAFSALISQIIRRSGSEEMSITEIRRQFDLLTGSGKKEPVPTQNEPSGRINSGSHPINPRDIETEQSKKRSVSPSV